MNNIDFIQGIFLKRLSLLYKLQNQDHERHDFREPHSTGLLGPMVSMSPALPTATSSLWLWQNEVQCSLLDT